MPQIIGAIIIVILIFLFIIYVVIPTLIFLAGIGCILGALTSIKHYFISFKNNVKTEKI